MTSRALAISAIAECFRGISAVWWYSADKSDIRTVRRRTGHIAPQDDAIGTAPDGVQAPPAGVPAWKDSAEDREADWPQSIDGTLDWRSHGIHRPFA